MNDFGKRSDMFKARIDALSEAAKKLRAIGVIHTLWTAVTVIAGLVVLWFNPTIRWAIGILVVLFLIRWAGNVFITVKYAQPERTRIDREFPAPPKRENGI